MRNIFISVLLLLFSSSVFSQDLYWIEKEGGVFDDAINWANSSGGNGGAGIPDAGTTVIFDENSGLEYDDVIIFEAGQNYSVHTFYVYEDSEAFTLDFQGESGNNTTLTIYDDLLLEGPIKTTFAELGTFYNQVIIDGNSEKHLIETGGVNLNHIEFKDFAGDFEQQADLYASSRIRMYGGEWNTNGFKVETEGDLLFQDNQASNNQYSKVVYTSGSDIFCGEFYARFVYGSLEFIGNHVIHANVFTGNPSQGNVITEYDEVVLLDHEPGLIAPIEDNNMDCAGCEFTTLRIEDVGITRIGGDIIIHTLIVENTDNIIQINGGNNRENFMVLDVVNTPSIGSCNSMPTIEAVYTSFGVIEAINSSVTLYRLKLDNVNAGSPGNFTLNSGILSGSSEGWTTNNNIPAVDYYWRPDNNNLWSDYKNWEDSQGQTTGCVPTLLDNVHIDNQSATELIVPINTEAVCKNFIWTKDDDYLDFDLNGKLIIAGNLEVGKYANFIGTGSLNLTGVGQYTIESGSSLPSMRFECKGSDYTLMDFLECESLYFDGANFYTNDYDIETDDWGTANVDGNNFYLGKSTITVNGDFNVAANNGVDQILDAGTSTIICDFFQSRENYEFYNLRLTNSSTFTFENWPFKFNRLELYGTSKVKILNDIEVEELILQDEDSELELPAGVELMVEKGITSYALSAGTSSSLRSVSSSNRGKIINENDNLCISGHIDLENLEFQSEGVVHAPNGYNLGGIIGVDFTPFNFNQSIPLYWIGRTNNNFAIRSNWSTVSGGCSTNYNPQNRPRLIFDEHSYYDNNNIVIHTVMNTHIFEFSNVTNEFIVDNRVELTFDNLELNSSYVRFIGQDYNVSNEIEITDGSVMDMRASNMISPSINIATTGFNNLVIVRDGSKLKQED